MEEEKYQVKLYSECNDDNNSHRFNLNYYIFQDEERYIAYCPSLDLTTSGKDFNDAVAQFYECFQLYVETCVETGTLIEDLKEHGWRLNGVTLIKPSFETLMMKQEFRNLMESNTVYDRLNAVVELNPVAS